MRILVPRGRAAFGQHQESRPLARSNDILVLNRFVNTIDWDQNQSDLSELTLGMRRVTVSTWIGDFRCWTWPEVAIPVFWPKGSRPLVARLYGACMMPMITPRVYNLQLRIPWPHAVTVFRSPVVFIKDSALEEDQQTVFKRKGHVLLWRRPEIKKYSCRLVSGTDRYLFKVICITFALRIIYGVIYRALVHMHTENMADLPLHWALLVEKWL